jgi:hypothetical protein
VARQHGRWRRTRSKRRVKSLGDAWADTTTPHGRLMLTVLGGLAEFERELILARTSDGRTRAKAKGVRFGRPPALTPHQRQEAIQRLANGEAQADIARTYAVSQIARPLAVSGGYFTPRATRLALRQCVTLPVSSHRTRTRSLSEA